MSKNLRRTAMECFLDLGITIVYAIVVGLIIVGIVASDDGPLSLAKAALYASLLPASVLAMIVGDVVLRVVVEARETRRRSSVAAIR